MHSKLLPLVLLGLITGTGINFCANAQFTAVDVGNPSPAGTVTPTGNGFNITAGGGDIGGTTDQFTFNYQMMTGDFDYKIRVNSLTLSDSWSKAGLMARATLTGNSPFAAAFATPGTVGSYFVTRSTNGSAAASSGSFQVNYPNTWLRLQRAGNLFTGYGSFDGENWVKLGSLNFSLTNTVFFGMAVSSRTNGVPVTAQIRDSQNVTNATVIPFIPEVEPAGPSSRLTPFAITEIMYNPAPNPASNILEFVEVFNSNPFFEEISGYRIAGDVDYTFPPNTFVPGNSYLVIARDPAALQSAYGITGVMGPYTNALKETGTVRLRNKENAILLEVPYENQPPWPVAADGAGHSIVLARPSYGERDPHAWAISDKVGGSPGRYDSVSAAPQRSVVINEFFANSEPPDEDFIELYNHSNQQVDISGCTLSDDPHTNKFVIRNGTLIPARGLVHFLQTELGFGLSSGGETIYFRSADGTRVLDAMRFGAQATGVSSGRSPDGGREVYPLQTRTPGAANAAIRVHDIVINEIMYGPISTRNDDEYVELYNKGTSPISIAGWKFTSGISFTFPENVSLAPKNYLVVAADLSRLRTNYSHLNPTNSYGNFKGSLRNKGDRVALAMPDISITTNSMNEVKTNTVYVVIDEVTYGVGGNWPIWADEGGSSMELIDPRSNHRLAHNWADSDETAKSLWTTIEFTGGVDNSGQTPNALEGYLLGEGECLLDDVEASSPGVSSGANLVPNGTFDAGLNNWLLRGTVLRSTLSTSGFGGGQCLYVRADSRGDSVINRFRTPLNGTLSGTATIRAKVRWLRGWPEIILRADGNSIECYGRMTVPANLGTPGLPNSRAATNSAPAIYEVKHAPIVPANTDPVIVTARVSDPDGLGSVTLKYRHDQVTNYTSVVMRDDGTGGDAIAGDGIFSATIPAPGVDALYAFQVTAADPLGASQLFPLQVPGWKNPFECLVRFGDPVITSGFATYRQWMTQSNLTDFLERPAMSNERLYETFVYGNFRVIYNTAMKWAGSPYHQFNAKSSGGVTNTSAHYSIDIPPDDLFLGTDNLNKIHGPGNSAFDDNTLQREQISYWMARQLGLPWNYRRFVNMFFNGNRRGGTANLMEDTMTPGADVINSYFPDDSDGNLYKLQPWFETDPDYSTANNGIGFANVAWMSLNKFTTLSNGVPVHKTAHYRNNYLVRAAKGTANDFQPVFDLVDAVRPTNNLPALTANLSAIADVEEWFRIFAVVHSIGDWDHFGYRNSQNIYGYKTDKGKWTIMIWDMNIVLGNSGSDGPGGNLFDVNGQDLVMPFFYPNPPFRRMYFRALKEICTSVWATNKYAPVLDAKYNAMIASGITPGNNGQAIKDYIASARSAILNNTIRPEDATNFVITTANVFDVTNNYVVLTGQAPVEAKTIKINGVEYPITWTSVKAFVIYVPVTDPSTVLTVQGYDVRGNPLAGFTTNVTVNFTGQIAPPESVLVFSEIMYNPKQPEASYIEIYNNSDFAYNISGWRINGVDYTFPDTTIITNRQSLVIAKNLSAFSTANLGLAPFGVFDGNLDKGGETLTLERPVPVYTTNGSIIVTNILYTPVNRVRYDDDAPWPTGADGQGQALQLIDASQDNARVSNWASGAAWQRVSKTGNIVNATNVILWLNSAGSCYIDDISLVGPAGTNILVNPGFETGSVAPWLLGSTAYAGSTVVSNFSHSGNNSLFIQGTASGGSFPNNVIQQVIADSVQNSNIYTLTFYALFDTNTVKVNMRPLPGNNLSINLDTAPIVSSPGQPNLLTGTLPPYDPVWLNELQPNNLTGITDNNGQREPWLELYNSGTNSIDLSEYYLANNYDVNLTQWQFPAGTTIGPHAFKIVWLDGEPGQTSGTNLHANFRLSSQTGSVALVRFANTKPQITDFMNYPVVGPDLSYGSAPDGQPFYRGILFAATPGSNNSFRTVNLFINEWMAGNTNFIVDPASQPGAPENDDWFELYNAGTEPVDLGGYYLTDNLNNHTQFQVPTNGQYVVPPGGFLLVWADGAPDQNNASRPDLHVNFQLARAGESIGLYAPDGQAAIDTITFGNQTNDVSQGRYADGASTLYFMTTPTPRAPNTIGGSDNHAPVLDPIADRFVSLGQAVSFVATGSDPDPGQSLAFSLQPGAPAGASITPGGQFHWMPVQSSGATALTVVVTDNGAPPLSATRTFTITVAPPPVISVAGNTVSITFPTVPGKTYRVDYKNSLSDPSWTVLVPAAVVASTSLAVTDNFSASPQRFYRIVQLD